MVRWFDCLIALGLKMITNTEIIEPPNRQTTNSILLFSYDWFANYHSSS